MARCCFSLTEFLGGEQSPSSEEPENRLGLPLTPITPWHAFLPRRTILAKHAVRVPHVRKRDGLQPASGQSNMLR